MTDLEMLKLCAEAMGWTYLGAVGVTLPEGTTGREADRLYPGQLWCLSGGNDWWKDPEGHSVCGRCEPIPDPLHDDAQAMALVKKFSIDIYHHYAIGWTGPITATLNDDNGIYKGDSEDLNRAIVEAVAKMQAAKP